MPIPIPDADPYIAAFDKLLSECSWEELTGLVKYHLLVARSQEARRQEDENRQVSRPVREPVTGRIMGWELNPKH